MYVYVRKKACIIGMLGKSLNIMGVVVFLGKVGVSKRNDE